MIVDITGTVLTPGVLGKDCLGNGSHDGIECCCDECDYLLCCLASHQPLECLFREDAHCPRARKKRADNIRPYIRKM